MVSHLYAAAHLIGFAERLVGAYLARLVDTSGKYASCKLGMLKAVNPSFETAYSLYRNILLVLCGRCEHIDIAEMII